MPNVPTDDPLEDACNKLFTLSGRAAAEDFLDVFFVVQNLFPFEKILAETKSRHAGFDAYWLAIAFQRVEKVKRWPTMKRSCDFEELKRFFLSKARQLLIPVD
jgi:hypothetical protein